MAAGVDLTAVIVTSNTVAVVALIVPAAAPPSASSRRAPSARSRTSTTASPAPAWADRLFMLGLAGIGTELILGVFMRIAAASGALMLVLMWSVVLPAANNPFMDDQIIYALVLVLLALLGAGRFLGFGEAWERLALVQRYPLLK